MEFKREDRYLILKRSDIALALDEQDMQYLEYIANRIAVYREMAGKDTLECVVVESDWPEYEHVWSMIQERCSHGQD